MTKLRTDLDVYVYRRGWPKFTWVFIPLLFLETWPILSYRYGNWVFKKVRVPIIRQLLTLIGFFLKNLTVILTNVSISERAEIGKGLFIAHVGTIVVSHHTKIGDYCSIHQGVTCGGAGRGDLYGGPTIGNYVYIGAGAKVLGKITVGDNTLIGANAVVVHDTESYTSVGGIPAHFINNKGSEGWIHFRPAKINKGQIQDNVIPEENNRPVG